MSQSNGLDLSNSSHSNPEEVFEILETLGRGAFGAVYKAKHKQTSQFAAIKKIPIDDGFQEVLKEIAFLKGCKNQYIVGYYGNFIQANDCWIVMEYCSVGSVTDMMKITNRTVLSEIDIATTISYCLKGLLYLHQNMKMHRDIKPGNILITSQAIGKLGDFGVSGETSTVRNTVIGTPFFLAPEIIKEEGYGEKADIWATGITLIELAEGNPPHSTLHPMRVLFMIPTSDPPQLNDKQKWSDQMHHFLSLCLKKDQNERATASQLLNHPWIKQASQSHLLNLVKQAETIIKKHGGLEEALSVASTNNNSNNNNIVGSPGSRRDTPESAINVAEIETGVINFGDQNAFIDDDDDDDDFLSKKSNLKQSEKGFGVLGDIDSILDGIANKLNSHDNNNSNMNNNNRSKTIQVGPSRTTENVASKSLDQLEFMLSDMMSAGSKRPNLHNNLNQGNNNLGSNSLSFISNTKTNNFENDENDLSLMGSWNILNQSAGGCPNFATWRDNKQFIVQVNQPSLVTITLTQIKNGSSNQFTHMGFYVLKTNDPSVRSLIFNPNAMIEGNPKPSYSKNEKITSNFDLDVGNYCLIATTFQPNVEGNFIVNIQNSVKSETIQSSATKVLKRNDSLSDPKKNKPVLLKSIIENLDWKKTTIDSEWSGKTAGGAFSPNSTEWRLNPQILITARNNTRVCIVLYCSKPSPAKDSHKGFYLFNADNGRLTVVQPNDLVAKTNFTTSQDGVSQEINLMAGRYIVLPCTYDVNKEGPFTLAVYGRELVKCELVRVTNSINGEWKENTSGGCLNYPSWRANPQYQLSVSIPSKVKILLEQQDVQGQPKFFIGMYFVKVPADASRKTLVLSARDLISNTQFVDSLSVEHEIDMDPQNPCIIIPSTYEPGLKNTFTIKVSSDLGTPQLRQSASVEEKSIQGCWRGSLAGGKVTTANQQWLSNPKYQLHCPRPCRITIILTQEKKDSYFPIAIYLFEKSEETGQISKLLGKSNFVTGREVSYTAVFENKAGSKAIILPATFEPAQENDFVLSVYSSHKFLLKQD